MGSSGITQEKYDAWYNRSYLGVRIESSEDGAAQFSPQT